MDMVSWIIGYVMGITIGMVIGKKQKPWTELTGRERKLMIALIGIGIVALAVGIIVFLLI